MKKILVLALTFCCLAIIALAPALAADRDDYVGTWVMAQPTSSGGAICEMFRLTADGKVFYMNEYFDYDAPSFGRQTVDVWRQTEDGIHIYYGEIAEADAFLSNGFLMIPGPGGYIPYGKVPEYSESAGAGIASKIPEDSLCILLPSGKYTVGVDFPAGEYAVHANASKMDIGFWVYAADETALWSSRIGDDEALEHISLSDGYSVDVTRGTAILSPVAIPDEGYVLPAGAYVVGREFPPVAYTVTADMDGDPVHFVVYDSTKKETVLDVNIANGESFVTAPLEDGHTIMVWHGSATLIPLLDAQ